MIAACVYLVVLLQSLHSQVFEVGGIKLGQTFNADSESEVVSFFASQSDLLVNREPRIERDTVYYDYKGFWGYRVDYEGYPGFTIKVCRNAKNAFAVSFVQMREEYSSQDFSGPNELRRLLLDSLRKKYGKELDRMDQFDNQESPDAFLSLYWGMSSRGSVADPTEQSRLNSLDVSLYLNREKPRVTLNAKGNEVARQCRAYLDEEKAAEKFSF